MQRPLEGIMVLDFSRAISGPWASMALAEMGAQVIKVEEPEVGDEVRGWPPFVEGNQSYYFFASNRSKESIVLNLKDPRGREIATKLAAQADIVLENFTPGVADRLKIGYKDVSAINPRVIYCSVSGFGQTGPYCNRKGYDPIVQAMGGIMSVTGEADGLPSKVGVPIGDLGAALFANQAILACLFHRERTGEGQFIDLSMLDGQVSLLTVQAAIYFANGKIPVRLGRDHPGRVPSTIFVTKDNKHIHLVANDNQWPLFCRLLDAPQLGEDPRFRKARDRVDHREEIMSVLVDAVSKLTRAEIETRLNENGIPCGPVKDIKEVVEDPQVVAREMITTFQHAVVGEARGLGWPYKFSTLSMDVKSAPPLLGEHTRSVLSSRLNLESAQLHELEQAGVIQTTVQPQQQGKR